jgi:hypothetical protein
MYHSAIFGAKFCTLVLVWPVAGSHHSDPCTRNFRHEAISLTLCNTQAFNPNICTQDRSGVDSSNSQDALINDPYKCMPTPAVMTAKGGIPSNIKRLQLYQNDNRHLACQGLRQRCSNGIGFALLSENDAQSRKVRWCTMCARQHHITNPPPVHSNLTGREGDMRLTRDWPPGEDNGYSWLCIF